MAAAATIIRRGSNGESRVVDVLCDSSYPSGGYALGPKDFGFGSNGTILFVESGMSKTGGWGPASWDFTNNKLQVFDASGAANVANHEVGAGTVLTGVSFRLIVWGIGTG